MGVQKEEIEAHDDDDDDDVVCDFVYLCCGCFFILIGQIK
jgi:hypothetical protein